jgi:tetratricopeptide (TPR) repeat protein
VNFIVFGERDLPLAKGLRAEHRVVTAWPSGRGVADISYEPGSETYDDLRRRFPQGFEPDAILLVNLEYVSFLWGLHAVEVPVFALISDSNLCFDLLRAARGFVDVFVCNEEEQSEKFLSMGCRAIYAPWFSVDSDLFHPLSEPARYDVAFVGNLNPYIHRQRGKFLEKLLSSRRFETRVLTDVYGEAYAKALSGGRIVFNHSVRGEVNMRVFEAFGLKRLLLMEDSNREVRKYFQDRQHFVAYNDANLLETIEHYLARPAEREAIAEAGHSEAMAKHTAYHRGTSLAEAVRSYLANRPVTGEKPSLDVLHRGAARILLQHGHLQGAVVHAEEAVKVADTAQNRLHCARIVGSVACHSRGDRSDLLRRFDAVGAGALDANPKSAFSVFNRFELRGFFGSADPNEIRGFVDDLEVGRLEIDLDGGPIQATYDPFRVAWEEVLYRHAGSADGESEAQKALLLSRAHELLGDEEQRRGRFPAAIESFSLSLKHRENGFVRQKLGSLESQLGKVDAARESLGCAVRGEAFFFAARRDLASVELNSGRRTEAREHAQDALAILTRPFRSAEGPIVEILDHLSLRSQLEPFKLGTPVHWQGLFFNTSGYAREASLLVDELLRRRLPITLEVLDRREGLEALDTQMVQRLAAAEGVPPATGFVHLFHYFAPDRYQKKDGAARTICRTTYETDRVPEHWLPVLQGMDQIWVMSEFNREVFIASGIRPERLAVIPSPLGEFPLARPEPVEILNKRTFNFLSVFEWGAGRGARKGPDLLLRAFLSEFTKDDDVSLVLRVYAIDGQSQIAFRDWARDFARQEMGLDPAQVPDVLVIDELLSGAEMRGLYCGCVRPTYSWRRIRPAVSRSSHERASRDRHAVGRAS